MKVLVTGAAGFIGSHVAEQLVSRGDEVVIVDSFDPFYDPAVKRRNITSLLASGKAELVEADIRDRCERYVAVTRAREHVLIVVSDR